MTKLHISKQRRSCGRLHLGEPEFPGLADITATWMHLLEISELRSRDWGLGPIRAQFQLPANGATNRWSRTVSFATDCPGSLEGKWIPVLTTPPTKQLNWRRNSKRWCAKSGRTCSEEKQNHWCSGPAPTEKQGKDRALRQFEKVQSGKCSQPLHKQFPQCLRISIKEASGIGKKGEFKTANKSLEWTIPPSISYCMFFLTYI